MIIAVVVLIHTIIIIIISSIILVVVIMIIKGVFLSETMSSSRIVSDCPSFSSSRPAGLQPLFQLM